MAAYQRQWRGCPPVGAGMGIVGHVDRAAVSGVRDYRRARFRKINDTGTLESAD